MRKKPFFAFIILILAAGSIAFAAANVDLGLGYQAGLIKDFGASAKPEFSHNGAFGVRVLWFTNPQIGIAFNGSIGALREFEWAGETFSSADGDLIRFSGLLGGSIRFLLTENLALAVDIGYSMDSKSLNDNTSLGENNRYSRQYPGYDTLRLVLSDSLGGVALNTAVQYKIIGNFYIEAGISVHYSISRYRTGTLYLADEKQPGTIWIPPPPKQDDITLASENNASQRVNIVGMGIPFILVGLRF
jgi:hypothetical protein